MDLFYRPKNQFGHFSFLKTTFFNFTKIYKRKTRVILETEEFCFQYIHQHQRKMIDCLHTISKYSYDQKLKSFEKKNIYNNSPVHENLIDFLAQTNHTEEKKKSKFSLPTCSENQSSLPTVRYSCKRQQKKREEKKKKKKNTYIEMGRDRSAKEN